MPGDRRKEERCGLGRRGSERTPCFHHVSWRSEEDGKTRTDLLAAASENGIALLTERPHSPRAGETIILSRWVKPAVVTRIDHLSGFLDLVAAQFVEPAKSDEPSPVSIPVTRDRRSENRGNAERRRSSRWETSRRLCWRVFHGRRIRHSQVVQRSLDGFVLMTEERDTPRTGTRFYPSDLQVANRFGFRSAMVMRTETVNLRTRLVYVEIEA